MASYLKTKKAESLQTAFEDFKKIRTKSGNLKFSYDDLTNFINEGDYGLIAHTWPLVDKYTLEAESGKLEVQTFSFITSRERKQKEFGDIKKVSKGVFEIINSKK